jgi:hypothetical protein
LEESRDQNNHIQQRSPIWNYLVIAEFSKNNFLKMAGARANVQWEKNA